MDPKEKIILNIREDIPIKSVERNLDYTGIAREQPVFFDQQKTTEKGLRKRKEEAENVIANNPPVITASCFYANDPHKDTTIVKRQQLAKPSRIHIEKNSDPTLLKFKREMLGIPFD